MRSHSAPNSVASTNADRRQLSRLRDLCDEVLASFRLAAGRDPISDHDRQAAREFMPALVRIGRE